MDKARKTLGLVLAKAPGYTETFMMSKIGGLIRSGFNVIVFGDKPPVQQPLTYRFVAAYRLPANPILRFAKIILVLMWVLLRSPKRVYRIYQFERKEGAGAGSIVRSIFISAHILTFPLDWIHFGFTTLAVGRENLGRAMGARLSTSFRGYDISIYPLRQPDVYRKLWNNLNKVHTISDDLYDEALELGLPLSIPSVKIRPAIDVGKFPFSSIPQSSGEVVKILTVARLQWKKGLEVALDAMALLKKDGVKFHYTIIGSGVDYDRLCFARYQLGLNQDVTFVGGKSHNQVIEMMGQHYLYLQPSLQEGFCNAVLEAQACGMLCIVTDAEGLPENIINNVTGWVVPKWDPVALQLKINEVLKLSQERITTIRNTARSRMESEFTLQIQEKSFQDFFTEL